MSRLSAEGIRISEHTVKVGEHNVHYWSVGEGNGRPVVLLHGGFGDAWANWNAVIGGLGLSFYVIAPDLPGYGQSDPLARPSAEALTRWLAAFMDAIGQPQAALIGHSYGALVARLLAAASPDRVPAAVLVNGGVLPSVPSLARVVSGLPLIGGALYRVIARNISSEPALLRAFRTPGEHAAQLIASAGANRAALSALLRGLAVGGVTQARQTPLVPVLLMWGEQDPISPLRIGEHIAGEIPGAQLAPVAECGHFPQLEVSDVFIAQVELFLNSIDRQQRDLPG